MVDEPLITYPSSQITLMSCLGCTSSVALVLPFAMKGIEQGLALHVGAVGE